MKKHINIHTHKIKYRNNTFSLFNICPEKFTKLSAYGNSCFSAGIHPWHIDSAVEEKIKILKQIVSNTAVLAIGETGLDRLCNVDFNIQKEIFNRHVVIAKETGKPLIIHCVRAWEEVRQILKESQIDVPVIFHGFRGKPQLAKELTNAGFYLSFGNLFNKKSLEATPLNRIFMETDDKDFAIEEVYRLVAEVKGVSVEKLVEVVWKEFREIFYKD